VIAQEGLLPLLRRELGDQVEFAETDLET